MEKPVDPNGVASNANMLIEECVSTPPRGQVRREAPSWETNPVAWCLWYAQENRHVYNAFRRAADERFVHYPDARMSGDAIMHHVRFTTPINAQGDMFKVNNNAVALFTRLYLAERPQHRNQFQRRRSFLDNLSPDVKRSLVRAVREPEGYVSHGSVS